jgi:hypothetical protein
MSQQSKIGLLAPISLERQRELQKLSIGVSDYSRASARAYSGLDSTYFQLGLAGLSVTHKRLTKADLNEDSLSIYDLLAYRQIFKIGGVENQIAKGDLTFPAADLFNRIAQASSQPGFYRAIYRLQQWAQEKIDIELKQSQEYYLTFLEENFSSDNSVASEMHQRISTNFSGGWLNWQNPKQFVALFDVDPVYFPLYGILKVEKNPPLTFLSKFAQVAPHLTASSYSIFAEVILLEAVNDAIKMIASENKDRKHKQVQAEIYWLASQKIWREYQFLNQLILIKWASLLELNDQDYYPVESFRSGDYLQARINFGLPVSKSILKMIV